MFAHLSLLTISFLVSLSAHASDLKGQFSAPAELSRGSQVFAVELTLDGTGGYQLVRDFNKCDFRTPGGMSCTEMAPSMTSGTLVFNSDSEYATVYTLAGSKGIELALAGDKNNPVVWIRELDDAGRVITARTLKAHNR